MHNKRPPIPVVILLVLALAAGSYYYFVYRNQAAPVTTLKASGTVEATEITIAPEVAGKITRVLVNEGDQTAAGDVLLEMDPAILQAQRSAAEAAIQTARSAVTTAQAAVDTAQAQYDLALAGALTEEQTRRTADWSADKPADFEQPTWYFDQAEQILAYQDQLKTAQTDLQSAVDELSYTEKNSTSQGFIAAETRLHTARLVYLVANSVLDRANNASDGQEMKDAAQAAFDDAKTELDNAQRLYDSEVTSDAALKVLQARARLQVARETHATLQDRLRALQTGTLSPKVIQAEKVLSQARAAALQSQAAQSQAEANLKLIDAQIQKLTILAPADGVVITRSVEPGEVANPGAALLTLARLTDLNITVYISEDRYGEISLGQAADVTVDSFPGTTFKASVTHIAEKAEFTPRNVQTADGRKATVFAIKLKVENTDGKLKYGMPADVTFR